MVKSVAPGGGAVWDFVINATGQAFNVDWMAEVEGSYHTAATSWRTGLKMEAMVGLFYNGSKFSMVEPYTSPLSNAS